MWVVFVMFGFLPWSADKVTDSDQIQFQTKYPQCLPWRFLKSTQPCTNVAPCAKAFRDGIEYEKCIIDPQWNLDQLGAESVCKS